MKVKVNEEVLQDCINIDSGLFSPLDGFLGKEDFHSVVTEMKLTSGFIWTIPISLDTSKDEFNKILEDTKVDIYFQNKKVGEIEVSEKFTVDNRLYLEKVFKTDDINHPGVYKESLKSKYRISGKIKITDGNLKKEALNPNVVKKIFKGKGWKTIVGFQTRNPIHNAHEHLHRNALEHYDGLFINPLIGWKKKGDFSQESVNGAYQIMLDTYYKNLNVYYNVLKTPMRYAGPREAVFHALIRKNLGCTHFIVGRDHAGVGNYYGKYEAQALCLEKINKQNLGIEILTFKEPFFCKKCNQMVSEKTCSHNNEFTSKISGTMIREKLSNQISPETIFMRKEVSSYLKSLKDKMFIE
jgi:sulfate adenylyltransferase